MQSRSSALVPTGADGRTFQFQPEPPEKPPRFRRLSGHWAALQAPLRAWYPSLSQAARQALSDAAHAHWRDWTASTQWPGLEPFASELLALPQDDTPRAVVLEAAKTLQLQMRWRRVREDRLEAIRRDLGYFHDGAFVGWLLEQPAPLLTSWAAQYVRTAVPGARRDAAFRLSRLRPMPLPILWAWTAIQHERAIASWEPSDAELRLHSVVSAAAQWLEWWASHRRRYWWPTEHVSLVSAQQAVDFALNGSTTGHLTIAQEVFDQARDLARRSVESASPPEQPGSPGTGRVRLHLVRTASPEVVTFPPSSLRALRCSVCQQAGDASIEVKEFPPYRRACTCQLLLDWEQALQAEAPYDWALYRWAESVRASVLYPFPTMRLLFKLNEELQERRCRGVEGRT